MTGLATLDRRLNPLQEAEVTVTTEATPISVQRSAVEMLDRLSKQYPDLPAAYTVIHQPYKGRPSGVDFQLDKPSDFGAWRTALGIEAASVSLHPHARGSWIEATTVYDGIRVTLAAHGLLLTEDQLNAPRGSEVAA